MSRIRTIKPSFFTSEDIVNLSPLARLLFIATWLEADREGRFVWKPKTLKLRYLPGDDCDIAALAAELVDAGLVIPYEVDGQSFAEIPTFTRHKVINNRESESVIPSRDGHACITRASRVDDATGTPLVQVQAEGKGKEGKETTYSDTAASLAAITGDQNEAEKVSKQKRTPCPHQEIIALYHEVLPTCPQIRDWTSARSALLRARWNEDPRRQNLDFWKRFFEYVAKSDFLTGRISTPGRPPFVASLEWLLKPEKFTKVREGQYHREAAA